MNFLILIGPREKMFTEDDKFQILCAIRRALNEVKAPATFPDALAQTCWKMKEDKGRPADA